MLIEREKEILKLIGLNNDNIEIEVRFGIVTNGKYNNTVPYLYYSRLQSFLEKNSEPIISNTTDELNGNIRKSNLNGEISWLNKKNIYQYTSHDFGILLSVSREIKLDSEILNWDPKVLRVKSRKSFILANGSCRLDLTAVDQTIFETGKTLNHYEVELEVLDNQQLKTFFNTIDDVFRWMYNTEEIWTYPERDEVIRFTNYLIQGKGNNIDTSMLKQLRNLKWEDCVNGGIIENKDTSYCVSHKADGVRKLLLCSKSGIWILYPNYEFNKISQEINPNLIGALLYIEEVPFENRIGDTPPKTKYWTLIFDCVAIDGDSNVSKQDYDLRMIKAQKISDGINDQFNYNLITVGTIKYRIIENADAFFSLCREFLNEKLILNYKDDGLIFTPMNVPVQPHSDKLPLNKRILTLNPDVCKWKPKEYLTNDFAIHWTMKESGKILNLDVTSNTEVEFLIYGRPPSVNRNIRFESGNIYAFKWDSYKKFFVHVGFSRKTYPHF